MCCTAHLQVSRTELRTGHRADTLQSRFEEDLDQKLFSELMSGHLHSAISVWMLLTSMLRWLMRRPLSKSPLCRERIRLLSASLVPACFVATLVSLLLQPRVHCLWPVRGSIIRIRASVSARLVTERDGVKCQSSTSLPRKKLFHSVSRLKASTEL